MLTNMFIILTILLSGESVNTSEVISLSKENRDTATFVGMGMEGHHDEEVYFDNIMSVEDCLEVCFDNKRTADHRWNGVVYQPSGNYCYCEKGDTGHVDETHYLHYRFV